MRFVIAFKKALNTIWLDEIKTVQNYKTQDEWEFIPGTELEFKKHLQFQVCDILTILITFDSFSLAWLSCIRSFYFMKLSKKGGRSVSVINRSYLAFKRHFISIYKCFRTFWCKFFGNNFESVPIQSNFPSCTIGIVVTSGARCILF